MGVFDAILDALTPDRGKQTPAYGAPGSIFAGPPTPKSLSSTIGVPVTGPTLHSVAQEPGQFIHSLDPRTPAGLLNLAMTLMPLRGDRPVLSRNARAPSRVFRTMDLLPGLAFKHPHGMDELIRAMRSGEGVRTPIEIDWDPTHGLASIIQGNHRLLAAKETGMPFLPGTIGQMYGDLGNYLRVMREASTNAPNRVYGQIKVGTAQQALIDRLLTKETQYANPDTGGLYHFRRDVNITPADWEELVQALGLKNVKVDPGTTIDQARAMFQEKYPRRP